jgi:hypothetical protein
MPSLSRPSHHVRPRVPGCQSKKKSTVGPSRDRSLRCGLRAVGVCAACLHTMAGLCSRQLPSPGTNQRRGDLVHAHRPRRAHPSSTRRPAPRVEGVQVTPPRGGCVCCPSAMAAGARFKIGALAHLARSPSRYQFHRRIQGPMNPTTGRSQRTPPSLRVPLCDGSMVGAAGFEPTTTSPPVRVIRCIRPTRHRPASRPRSA